MTNIIPFNFNSHTIRVIQDDLGDLAFVAKDATDILGYRDATTGLRSVPDKHKGTHSVCTPGGDQVMSTVDEPGLYRLVLRSDKPEAEPFMEWVTSDVLPTIRKTGSYSAPVVKEVKPLIEANRLFKSNLTIARTVFKGNQALLSANMATRQATDVDVLGNIGATHLLANERDALLTASDIGKQIGLSGQKVNLLLEEKGLVVSFRDHKDRKQYELTEDGEKFGEALDTAKKHSDGTPIKQIKWYSRIVELLKGESAA